MYKLLGRILVIFTVALISTALMLRLIGLGPEQIDAAIVATLEGLSVLGAVLWSDDLFKDSEEG